MLLRKKLSLLTFAALCFVMLFALCGCAKKEPAPQATPAPRVAETAPSASASERFSAALAAMGFVPEETFAGEYVYAADKTTPLTLGQLIDKVESDKTNGVLLTDTGADDLGLPAGATVVRYFIIGIPEAVDGGIENLDFDPDGPGWDRVVTCMPEYRFDSGDAYAVRFASTDDAVWYFRSETLDLFDGVFTGRKPNYVSGADYELVADPFAADGGIYLRFGDSLFCLSFTDADPELYPAAIRTLCGAFGLPVPEGWS